MKEVETLDTVLLFGKYQLCRILGAGRFGTVFLAVHTGLMEYRAVKRVQKSLLDYEHFRREALILKELRHPGIPIVYDIEEDEEYGYLIEEYLEGESFFDLVTKQGHLSGELTICYGIQLARIVHYLHSAGENPILHLDLQPRNLLLCHDTVKLVDFGQADYAASASRAEKRYGTPGYAAPEQYQKEKQLNPVTDIYGIGVILHYLHTGDYPQLPYHAPGYMNRRLAEIIGSCLREDPSKRTATAKELELQLSGLGCAGTEQPDLLSSLIIALAGSKPGAGVTHMAVGLSVYLKHHGIPNLYEEKNDSGMGAALGEALHAQRDGFGLMTHNGFTWKPRYGPGVSLKEPPYAVRIADYGTDINAALSDGADGLVIICDGSLWSRKEAQTAAGCIRAGNTARKGPVIELVYNHTDGMAKVGTLPHIKGQPCLKAPYMNRIWGKNAVNDSFFHELTAQLVQNGLLGQSGSDSKAGQAFCWKDWENVKPASRIKAWIGKKGKGLCCSVKRNHLWFRREP